jgi:aspartate aminotransferase
MVTGNQVAASLRAKEAVPSPMRKLSPLAEQAVAEGVHIYHLNIGQPDIATPAAIMDSIRHYEDAVLPYAPSQGLKETIDAWRAYYSQFGLDFGPLEVLVTSGGSEALLFTLMAVADPGEEVIVFEPTYANYFGFARMTFVKLVPVTTRPEDGYHLPPVDEIEARITPRTKALLFANPGNPTGTVYSYDELRVLSDIAARHDLFLISDETYREIVFDGPRDMSMMKVTETAGQTVLVDSVSKRFSATGARIGCIASHHEGVMDGVLRFAQARLAAPTVEQRAVVSVLRHSHQYTQAVVEEYRKRRDIVYRALHDIPGVLVRLPEGAFYIQAVLPIDDAERFASWLLTDFRLGGETLMIAPGDGFYLTPGMGRHEVRIAFVLEGSALERAMNILREALRVYPGATM